MWFSAQKWGGKFEAQEHKYLNLNNSNIFKMRIHKDLNPNCVVLHAVVRTIMLCRGLAT
jgi:hypothetical protein